VTRRLTLEVDGSPFAAAEPALSVLVPDDCIRIRLTGGRSSTAIANRRISEASPGTVVAAADGRLGSRRRIRRMFQNAGVELVDEYVVLPSLDSPVIVVQDSSTTMLWSWRNYLTVPPGAAWSAGPAYLAISLARRLPPGVLSAVLPQRLALGRVR
jgi:hypothetical protein